MWNEKVEHPFIEELLAADVGQRLKEAAETIAALQQGLRSLHEKGGSKQLELLKIGTVFQIFFLDTLASGKNAEDLTEEDWKNIAEKVYRYAVLEDGQCYSEFVFSLYADYIDISAETLRGITSEKSIDSIKQLSGTIRHNTELFRKDEMTETAYVEAELWLSLEAMLKLLSSSLTACIDTEYAELVQAVTQFAFEYGRYSLYAREREILDRDLQNQKVLDEQLKRDYEEYLEEVNARADVFQKLVDEAFSPDIHESLIQSVALAREAGVKEEELLTSVEDIDAFFMS